jgi:hypothetical protein
MAQGRFLSKSISVSDQVAALPNDTARLLFTWMIPHADVKGRLLADPRKIKGLIFTMSDRDLEEIEQALQAMQEQKLIQLYSVDGTRYLCLLGWSRHQKVREDREGQPYPEPTKVPGQAEDYTSTALLTEATPGGLLEDSGSPPGAVQKNSGLSRSSSRSSRSTKEGAAALESARGATDETLQALLDTYNQHRGQLPEARALTRSRRKHLAALLKDFGLQEARDLVADATSNCAADEFWKQKGFALDNLLRDDRVVARAEKQRAKPQTAGLRDDIGALAQKKGWKA